MVTTWPRTVRELFYAESSYAYTTPTEIDTRRTVMSGVEVSFYE